MESTQFSKCPHLQFWATPLCANLLLFPGDSFLRKTGQTHFPYSLAPAHLVKARQQGILSTDHLCADLYISAGKGLAAMVWVYSDLAAMALLVTHVHKSTCLNH